MTTIDLSTVTIPAADEYDEAAPQKNLENLAYVLLQVLTIAKTAGIKLSGTGDLMLTIESFSASVLAAADYES
jgi:NTP pyrophosphatase (non-canonical NTP hydrolase)